jgi:hypothetical protein
MIYGDTAWVSGIVSCCMGIVEMLEQNSTTSFLFGQLPLSKHQAKRCAARGPYSLHWRLSCTRGPLSAAGQCLHAPPIRNASAGCSQWRRCAHSSSAYRPLLLSIICSGIVQSLMHSVVSAGTSAAGYGQPERPEHNLGPERPGAGDRQCRRRCTGQPHSKFSSTWSS